MNRRYRLVGMLSISLILSTGPGLIASADGPATCTPNPAGIGACDFAAGDAGGIYVYDTIRVPVGVIVTATSNLVLDARLLLEVGGAVQSASPAQPGQPGLSIRLKSDGAISVSGQVTSGRASDVALVTTDANATAGTQGAAGGALYVTAGSLTVTASGRIGAGAGGAGGDVRLEHDASDPPQTNLTTRGGGGGPGGSLSINSLTATVDGVLVQANGGRGGNGDILIAEGTLASFYPSANSAFGGTGADAGALYLPSGFDPTILYNAGRLTGGVGGTGGDATTQSTTPTEPVAAGACGADGTQSNINGDTGCRGADAWNYGGTGGCATSAVLCLFGGKGGRGTATGLSGGKGGNGVDGERAQILPLNIIGGNGGKGGTGGHGEAAGGRGGSGLIRGGQGGDAAAFGGRGGTGGQGGDTGWLFKGTSGFAYPVNCFSLYPACWLALTPDVACGHIGFPGAGGDGGTSWARGGGPGYSDTGMNDGYGSKTNANGATGTGGAEGNVIVPPCFHAYSHAHLNA